MNKILNKLIAGAISLGMLCTCAFAADPISVNKDGADVTVTVSSLSPNEETTVLVIPPDVTISKAFENISVIHHMDQIAASAEGVATFNFKYSGEGDMCIYSGYATMSADDVPYEGVLDLSGGTGGEDNPGADFTYGDVNNDGDIDTLDALAVINYYLHETAFTDSENDDAEYELGLFAADVNDDGDIDTLDALAIINKYLHETEF